MKIVPAAKVLGVNLAVFVAGLLLLNALCMAALTAYESLGRFVSLGEPGPGAQVFRYWPSLPNYPDKARAKAIFTEFDSLRTRYEPFIGWSRLPFRGVTTTVNEAGDRVHGADPRAAPTRLARFFGGSTMWGTGVDDQGTIPTVFQALAPQFRALNHGESSFTSRQALERLINLVSRDEPIDLVVFYDGYNDVMQQCRHEAPVPGHSRVMQIREALARSRSGLLDSLSRAGHDLFLAHTLSLGRRAVKKLLPNAACNDEGGKRGKGFYDCDDDPEKARAVARSLVANWEIARDIVERRGGEFHAILQPHAHVGSPRVDHVARYFDPEEPANHGAAYPLVQQLITGRDWIHDFTDAFDEERTGRQFLLIDDAHVTSRGNAIIAARIARIVEQLPAASAASSD